MWNLAGNPSGPVIFLTMNNDVASSIPFRWKYVDDVTVGESVPHSEVIAPSSMQDAMDIVRQHRGHMSLNFSKCIILQLSFKRSPPPPLHVAVMGNK